MHPSLLVFFLFSVLPSYSPLSSAQQLSSFSISDSPWFPNETKTLVSRNSTFAAGFQVTPSQRYIFAIWYQNASNTIIWTLNGDNPVNSSSSLEISTSGALVLIGVTGINILRTAVGKPNSSELVLGEDGGLVFESWTSFDFPTDTILPNQDVNGKKLISRKDNTTYASGKYEFRELNNLVFESSDKYWDWDNGKTLRNLTSEGSLVFSDGSALISADLGTTGRLRRLTLDPDGNLRIYSLDRNSSVWTVVWQAIQEVCTIHGTCGPNYICKSDGSYKATCICPTGFRDNGACERIKPLNNPNDGNFIRLDFVKFNEKSHETDLQAPNLTTCQSTCRSNPKCLGFSYKFDGKRYCVHHIDHLLNGYWSPGTEMATYIRVSSSESNISFNFTGMTSRLDTTCPVRISLPFPTKESQATKRNLVIICSLFALELIGGVLSFWAFLRKYSKYRDMAMTFGLEFLPAGGPKRFTYAEIKAATKDFSDIVGYGGFGVVYRGELPDRRIVAVKRLKDVGGGEAEFWAEVTIIARMHHLNLVRMWGFCAERSQRMLVYEYISNGSLDKFLFPTPVKDEIPIPGKDSPNTSPKPLLDWNIRYRIALGVARAIAYLHEECLEWVLHCDIKPENILLEEDFCPKVSDFGLAKLAKKEDMVSVSHIRGTRGYLAPEWVNNNPITAKADVYSFGMVLLEIVSGIRNFEFRRSSVESEDLYFPKWAFEKVYVEKHVEDILDCRILDSYDSRTHFEMVDRMVKTAMWCLQERAELRPSMGKVAKMLEGTVEITEPEKPKIFYLRD